MLHLNDTHDAYFYVLCVFRRFLITHFFQQVSCFLDLSHYSMSGGSCSSIFKLFISYSIISNCSLHFPELKILETAFIFISGDLLGLFHIHDSFTSVLYYLTL